MAILEAVELYSFILTDVYYIYNQYNSAAPQTAGCKTGSTTLMTNGGFIAGMLF